jgi:hypothetical protein
MRASRHEKGGGGGVAHAKRSSRVRGMRPGSSCEPTSVCVLPVPGAMNYATIMTARAASDKYMYIYTHTHIYIYNIIYMTTIYYIDNGWTSAPPTSRRHEPGDPIANTLTCIHASQARITHTHRHTRTRITRASERSKCLTFCSFFMLEAMAGPMSSKILSLRTQAS